MTYNEAVQKVIGEFEKLSSDKQLEVIRSYYSANDIAVAIHPMSFFNAYCEYKWEGNYKEVAQIVCQSFDTGLGDFDFDDSYFMDDEAIGYFISGFSLIDLVARRAWITNILQTDQSVPADFILYVIEHLMPVTEKDLLLEIVNKQVA